MATAALDDGPRETGIWRVLGLTMQAPFEVGRAVSTPAAPDVVVRCGDHDPPQVDETCEIVAEMRTPARVFYTVYRSRGGYLQRFHGSCDFFIDNDVSEVLYWTAPGFDEGLLPVLVAGTVTSLLLTLRGRPVLHGSAVNWHGLTVAFAGCSGKGKTTLAALCCAAGAQFVCDDVVPLAPCRDGDGVMCIGLGHELRLRPAASEIADLFPVPGPSRRTTADGRLAIRPQSATNEENRLSALVVPQPSRSSEAIRLRRLGPSVAVSRLLANSRVPALRPLDLQRPYFDAVTALAASVPVIEAEVPWGPPFTTTSARELLELLEAGSDRVTARAL